MNDSTMNFTKFCNAYNKKLLTNPDAAKLFDYLCTGEAIANFMAFTSVGLPAISGIASYLEDNYDNNTTFSMETPHNRQMVGKMVKFILGFFGFEPETNGLEERAQLRNFSNTRFFKTAAIYHRTNSLPEKTLTILVK